MNFGGEMRATEIISVLMEPLPGDYVLEQGMIIDLSILVDYVPGQGMIIEILTRG